MEGVASEAASLAGHLGLSNLCWIYDSNRVTIEGPTDLAFSENVETRFKGYRWTVLRVRDANDTLAIARALQTFRRTKNSPTLVIVESIIGYGAPHKQNTAAAHSDALGEEEVRSLNTPTIGQRTRSSWFRKGCMNGFATVSATRPCAPRSVAEDVRSL